MGLDAVRWAHEGIIDLVTITPFWETSDFNMPVRLWRRLLDGTNVTLAAGLEILVRPYHNGNMVYQTPETTTGAAVAALHGGADAIYLFNHFYDMPGQRTKMWGQAEAGKTLMKILIIGGTGLISTAITRFLVERGDDVTLYNRGQREVRTPPTKMIYGDRRDYAAFERQMAAAGTFDCVIDMICFLPEEAESDVRAFKGRTGQFIFTSTVDVYTKPATRYPYTESEPLSGVSLYGKKKVVCESVFSAAHAREDLPVTIIRPAYTYGEGQSLLSWRGRDNYLIDRLRKGKPIISHGDGTPLWVCCHIDDAARAYLGATGNARSIGRAYHVTGEEWMTWDQYYKGIAGVLGAPSPNLVHIPSDLLAALAPKSGRTPVENFMFDNVFDNSAARSDLGFRYTITWKRGVARVVPWLESRGLVKNSDEDTLDDKIVAAWQSATAEMVEMVKGLDN